MIRSLLLLSALSAVPAVASAQDVAVPPGTVALSPEEREAALEAGAARSADKSLQNGVTDRRVHGEVGVEVGSRGERAAYGTMVAPIGQNGVAAISYGTGQGPRWRGRGRGRFSGTSVGAAYSSEAAQAQLPPSVAVDQADPD